MGLITVHGRSWVWPSDTNVQPSGSSGALTFAVLADPQLGFLPQPPADYQEELRRLNTAAVDMEKYSPNFVIVLGDLVQILPNDDRNQEERAVQNRKIHDAVRAFPARTPVFVLCGNHDVGNAPTERSLRQYQELWGDDYYAFDIQKTRCIVLNSCVFFDSTNVPAYAEEQLRWLELQLEEAVAQKRIPLLFMHHPIYWDDWEEPDDLGPLYVQALKLTSSKSYFHLPRKWRDPLRALIQRYKVRYSFHGHLHDNRVVTTQNPMFEQVVTSAIGYPLGDAGAGYRIVTVKEGEKQVEHRFIELFPNSLISEGRKEATERAEDRNSGTLREWTARKDQAEKI